MANKRITLTDLNEEINGAEPEVITRIFGSDDYKPRKIGLNSRVKKLEEEIVKLKGIVAELTNFVYKNQDSDE